MMFQLQSFFNGGALNLALAQQTTQDVGRTRVKLVNHSFTAHNLRTF